MLVTSLSHPNKNWTASFWPNIFLVFSMVLTTIPPAPLGQSNHPEGQDTTPIQSLGSKGSQDCQLKLKCALHFNGVDQWVNLEQFHGFDTPAFTLETWFNWAGDGTPIPAGDALSDGIPFITVSGSSDSDTNLFFGIQASTGKLMAVFKEEPSIRGSIAQDYAIFGDTQVTTGVWHHAAATYDGQTWKLFLDGDLNASLTYATPIQPQLVGSQHAYLAAALSANGEGRGFFKGDLDEVRFWETARSQNDIQDMINLETVSDLNLNGHWNMNEGTGIEENDSSESNIQGKSVNNPTWTNGAPFNLSIVAVENLETNTSISGPTNVAPDSPTLISPANDATGVSTSPTLTVSVSDSEASNLEVTFYGRAGSGAQVSDFTLAVIPDTQKYTLRNNLGIFGTQTQWIVDQRSAQNIAFVTHLGDMVDDWNVASQWVVANAAMSKLEPVGIPYGITPGNSDEDHYGVPPDTTWFNTYFPVSRFAGRPYYGGAYNGDNANSYQLFSASGINFIVIHLKYNLSTVSDQSLAVLNWADNLLKTYSNRRAIVVTHNLLTTSNIFTADGSQIYNKLKENPNLFLMMGGHLDTEGQRQDLGTDGHTIYSLRSDYQTRANGGNGWLRLMRFSPSTNKIYVSTYSPYLNQYETDADSQFSLDYAMNATGFQVIGTANVPSGSNASVNWPSLSTNTQYEWYVTVNDGTETTTGSTWNFTTGNETGLPIITSQPVNQTVNAGQTATFSATASGTPTPTVQWQVSTDGNTWNDIVGATSTTYSFTSQSADSGKQFRAVFTNSAGSINSNIAMLTVNIAPLISAQPANQIVNAGQVATFSAAASGFPTPTVQWQFSTDGVTWSNISGATSSVYSFTSQAADNGKQFRAVFTNVAGSVDSNAATLRIFSANVAPFAPALISPANGATGVPASPTLTVSVSDPESDNLTVTFYGGAITGIPNPDFTLAVLPDTQKYTINGMGIFDTQTQWIVDQRSAENIVFVSHLGGMVDDWNVPSQWNVADTAMSKLELAGIPYGIGVGNTDEDHYGIPPDTTYFNTYFPVSRFAGRPYYGGAYNGDNANSYQLFSASGMDFIVINLKYNLSYSVDQSEAILTWADNLLKTHSNRRAIVITHSLLTTSNVFSTDGSQIYNKLKENPNLFLMMGGHLATEGQRQDLGSDGHTIYSLRSAYQTRTNGGDGWLRLLRFSPSTNKIYVTTYSPYLNQYETDADSQFALDYAMSATNFQVIGTANVPSGSNASVNWPSLSASTLYEWYVTVSDGILTTTGSAWTFTTESGLIAPVVTNQPVNQTVNESQLATFSAAASGSPTPTVQWQVSTDSNTWNNIAGAISTTYTFTAQATDNGKQFRAVFTNSAGSATSNAATLTVNTAPIVTTQPTSQTINPSQTATFSAAASGSPTPTVQWQVSTDGSTWNNIAGATTTTYTFTAQATDNGKQFRAVFTNVVGSATSNAAILTLTVIVNYYAPVVIIHPVNQAITIGQIISFTATAIGDPYPSVQWQVSIDSGDTWIDIAGATSTTYTFTTQSADNGKQFRAIFTNFVGSAISNAATLTVNYAPTIITHPANLIVRAGQTVSFTAAASGNPSPSVQWQVSIDSGSTWTNIAGAISTTYIFTSQSADNGKQFRAIFTNLAGSATTNAATLTVYTAPTVTTQPVNQTVIETQTATFSATASGYTTPNVQWQVSSDNGISWNNISGATSTTYSFIAQLTDNNKIYHAVFSNPVGTAISAAAMLTVVSSDLIFKDGFNSCNATAWTGGTVNSARLAFNTTSGRNSTCGMAVTIASSAAAYVIDPLPNAEARFRARFYFNPNTVKMGRNIPNTIYVAYNLSGKSTVVVQIRYTGSVFQLRTGILSDANSWSYTSWTSITKTWHAVEFDWRASTTTVANNGGLTFWIDGVQRGSISKINNDQHKIDKVALGAVLGINSAMSGTYFFDDYESHHQGYIGQ